MITTKTIAACALAAWAGATFSHEIPGLAGAHWHAADILGLLLVGALAALAHWRSRRRK